MSVGPAPDPSPRGPYLDSLGLPLPLPLPDLASFRSDQGPKLPQTPEVHFTRRPLWPPSLGTPRARPRQEPSAWTEAGEGGPHTSPSGPTTRSREGLGPSLWGPVATVLGPGGRGAAGRRCPCPRSLGATGRGHLAPGRPTPTPTASVLPHGWVYLHASPQLTKIPPPSRGGRRRSQSSEAEVGARHFRTP